MPSTAGDCSGQSTRDVECMLPRAISPFVLNDEKSSQMEGGCHCSVARWHLKCRAFASCDEDECRFSTAFCFLSTYINFMVYMVRLDGYWLNLGEIISDSTSIQSMTLGRVMDLIPLRYNGCDNHCATRALYVRLKFWDGIDLKRLQGNYFSYPSLFNYLR